MNHKRKRPKSKRAGCLMCKPWKHERAPKVEKRTVSDRRAIARAEYRDA